MAMTIVDGNGEIKYFDQSHPDLKVMAACLGMCGIVLDVTVRFNPDTSANKVTQTKMQYQDLFPPRGVPISENYNPLKTFIEGHAGGAINYSPYNSALLHSGKLDVNKVEEYHQSDGVWTHAVDTLPGTSVCPVRTGLPIWGTQHEPFYDKDLFVPVKFGGLERGKSLFFENSCLKFGKSHSGLLCHVSASTSSQLFLPFGPFIQSPPSFPPPPNACRRTG